MFLVKMVYVLSHRTHVHTPNDMRRITTLTFTFLTNFKISNFNKQHMSSLKMI